MGLSSIRFEEKDLGYKKIVKEIKKLNDSETNVGLWGNGNPEDNLAARATVHEYGSPSNNIPKRPFNRQAFSKNLKDLKRVIDKLYNVMLARRIRARKLLSQVGDWYTGKLKDQITFGSFTKLKAATIKRKKSSKPLIDTADMRNRIQHKEKM